MNEWYYRRAEEIKNWESPHGRIVPAYKAIKDLPGVLPCENYPELLKAQDLIAVTPCSCRYRLAAVGKPCAHYNKEDERWTCIQFGRGAEYAIKRGSGKKLSLGEALDLSDHIEDEGLMHVWTNDTNMTGIITSCQCCRDCCMSYVPLEMTNLPHTLRWAKSRYQAYTELAECTGCQVCIDRCPFDAIEMKRLPGEKKMKAVVDPEKCFGCAVCVTGCKPKALKMKVVRPPEHIPVAVEKSHSSGM
jgi:NAD-dependent dihydropyrimidine dehydrogenase PreA subunit